MLGGDRDTVAIDADIPRSWLASEMGLSNDQVHDAGPSIKIVHAHYGLMLIYDT